MSDDKLYEAFLRGGDASLELGALREENKRLRAQLNEASNLLFWANAPQISLQWRQSFANWLARWDIKP